MSADPKNPVVFISYTHEDSPHKAWVASLATDLRRKGIDIILDQWDLGLGQDITLFMEDGIRRSNRVILICTPSYARKANEGMGGVGYERLVVTGEIAKNIATEKFICVLKLGTKDESIPIFAQTRLYADFSNPSKYDDSLDELWRNIHQIPKQTKPPLGPLPTDITSQTVVPPAISVEEFQGLISLVETGVSILRSKDTLGWKRLVSNIRRRNDAQLAQWRDAAIKFGASEEEWIKNLHSLLDIIAPFLILSLVAIQSEIEELHKQFSFIDDLLTPHNWPKGGQARLVSAPEAMTLSYHYVVGAFLVIDQSQEDAIDLLRMRVRRVHYNDKLTELRKCTEVMGWTDAIAGNCISAWNYLINIYDQHTWLESFFANSREYIDSLRAYQLLASILEMAEDLGTGIDPRQWPKQELILDVPPMFLTPVKDGVDLERLIRMIIPTSEIRERIASSFGITSEKLVQAWPHWFRSLIRWGKSSGMRRFAYRTDVIPSLDPNGKPIDLVKLAGLEKS
jgi:hypothetical protein